MSHTELNSHFAHRSGVSRRGVLCAAGAAAFSALVGALLGGAKPARAQALGGAVPEVERLAARVVIDSFQQAISPGTKVGEVEVQRFGLPPAGKSLLEEFGLSMHLESRRGSESRNLLLDFGFTSGTLNNNLAMLGIAPESKDRSCSDGRVPPRATQGAVRARDGGGLEGHQSRPRDPDALHRGSVHRHRPTGDAEQVHTLLDRQPLHFRCLAASAFVPVVRPARY
jgi:hypothetical protein